MGGTRKQAKTQNQARTPYQEDHDLCLIELVGSRTLGNGREQHFTHLDAPNKQDHSNEKAQSTRPSHSIT